jgi:hypothetical protein
MTGLPKPDCAHALSAGLIYSTDSNGGLDIPGYRG